MSRFSAVYEFHPLPADPALIEVPPDANREICDALPSDPYRYLHRQLSRRKSKGCDRKFRPLLYIVEYRRDHSERYRCISPNPIRKTISTFTMLVSMICLACDEISNFEDPPFSAASLYAQSIFFSTVPPMVSVL